MLLTTQGCARLRTGPIIMQIPRGYQKKKFIVEKGAICAILIGALSCMRKGPKCIQSLWDHPKKIPFVQKHKEGAICAILREKNPFLAFPEAKKGVVNHARLRKSAHWPNNNANPSGLS